MKTKTIITITCVLSSTIINAQILYSNGAQITINNGGNIYCNGGVYLTQNSILENEGELTITKNSTLIQPGNFEFLSGTYIYGDGVYRVEQDWINSSVFATNSGFHAGSSEVILFGDTEQLITSNNSTQTEFNNLTLTGNGNGVNARKTLSGVNAAVGSSGVLNLNNRELNTNIQDFIVYNPNANSVINSTTFLSEGFVSSTQDGYLIRLTNNTESFIFPVGSSDGDRRYRPVKITPKSATGHMMAVRMNNYSAENDGWSLNQHTENIGVVNQSFYHSIEDLSGDMDSDLGLLFLPSEDSDWAGIGSWSLISNQWGKPEISNTDASGNYKLIEKVDWTINSDNISYALVDLEYTINIPEAISPNDDGKNDAFFIEGLEFYPNTEVWIYNRWGVEVYHSDNYKNDWNGISESNLNIGNGELPEGTYYYILTLGGKEEQLGAGDVHKGFIYLTR
ncbi:MAG: gliding motility-associated C-terminal domain-containing protein [Brumimicrobium sp.]